MLRVLLEHGPSSHKAAVAEVLKQNPGSVSLLPATNSWKLPEGLWKWNQVFQICLGSFRASLGRAAECGFVSKLGTSVVFCRNHPRLPSRETSGGSSKLGALFGPLPGDLPPRPWRTIATAERFSSTPTCAVYFRSTALDERRSRFGRGRLDCHKFRW